jgi:hypothetical protein
MRGSSPWLLQQGELLRQLAQGAAQAVTETGRVGHEDLAAWRVARESATACEIGHMDLFAKPF